MPLSHARQDKPTSINQGWKIVADISPRDLQGELKKLNEAGYVVQKDTNSIRLDGGRFTVIVNEDDRSEVEEEEGDGK